MSDPVDIPAHIQPYVDVLGIALTIDFLLAFGGAPLYLPSERTHGSSMIANVIGSDMAVKLGKAMGRGSVRVPLAKPFIARYLFATNVPIVEIARRLHLSDVTVRKYLPNRAAAVQLGLFDQ